MNTMFMIEDEAHAEQLGEHDDRAAAISRLHQLSELPWDQPPNVAPCRSWQTCGRRYELVEYDTATTPWRLLTCTPAMNISAGGVEWLIEQS